MSMKALMSAAHAAGYAMAAEELAEPRPEFVRPQRESTALVVRSPQQAPPEMMAMRRFMRRFWLRLWIAADHWPGRATPA
jgi:hypothetical protein